jgi:hypothetical protein
VTNSGSSYEWLREEISRLDEARDPSSRRLVWVTAEHSVAVSRDTAGRLEVYLEGKPIRAVMRAVAEVLEHQAWRTDDDVEIVASRVVLPTGEHFDQFGAFLCKELVDHDVSGDAQAAFASVEPLIAMALTRDTVGDLTLIGLIGELSFLEMLLATSAPAAVPEVLRAWAGSAPSARDFQLRAVGVEVKTTQGASSTHHIEGVHQVELGRSNEDVWETDLFMLSLGVSWVRGAEGRTLPELVDSILGHVADPEHRADLLARIKQYGGDASLGYDHSRDRVKSRYASRFYLRFERLYDLTDDRIRLLTSEALTGLTNVESGSVGYRVVLADRIRGERNPVASWDGIAKKVLHASGIPAR